MISCSRVAAASGLKIVDTPHSSFSQHGEKPFHLLLLLQRVQRQEALCNLGERLTLGLEETNACCGALGQSLLLGCVFLVVQSCKPIHYGRKLQAQERLLLDRRGLPPDDRYGGVTLLVNLGGHGFDQELHGCACARRVLSPYSQVPCGGDGHLCFHLRAEVLDNPRSRNLRGLGCAERGGEGVYIFL